MKKTINLFVALALFIFIGCVGEKTTKERPVSVDEVVECSDNCVKACCLGCRATEGKLLCLADHSCCFVEEESADNH